MKRSYVVNCASSGVILTKIEATTARESPLSMTLAANLSIPNHDKCTGEKCRNSKVSLYVTIVLSKTLLISVHVGKYHDPTGTLRKNVSLVQKSRRTSIERSFFAECPCETVVNIVSASECSLTLSYRLDLVPNGNPCWFPVGLGSEPINMLSLQDIVTHFSTLCRENVSIVPNWFSSMRMPHCVITVLTSGCSHLPCLPSQSTFATVPKPDA